MTDDPWQSLTSRQNQYVNLVTSRQFELFGATEAFAFAVLLLGAGLTGPTGLVALTIGAIVYGLFKLVKRQQRCRETAARVEATIREIIANPQAVLGNDYYRLNAA
jgi:hypothetical protein